MKFADSNFLAFLECKKVQQKHPTQHSSLLFWLIEVQQTRLIEMDRRGRKLAKKLIRRGDLNTFWYSLSRARSTCTFRERFSYLRVGIVFARSVTFEFFRAGERSGLNCAHLQVGAFWLPKKRTSAITNLSAAPDNFLVKSTGKKWKALKSTCAGGLTFARMRRISTQRICAVYLREHTLTPDRRRWCVRGITANFTAFCCIALLLGTDRTLSYSSWFFISQSYPTIRVDFISSENFAITKLFSFFSTVIGRFFILFFFCSNTSML